MRAKGLVPGPLLSSVSICSSSDPCFIPFRSGPVIVGKHKCRLLHLVVKSQKRKRSILERIHQANGLCLVRQGVMVLHQPQNVAGRLFAYLPRRAPKKKQSRVRHVWCE